MRAILNNEFLASWLWALSQTPGIEQLAIWWNEGSGLDRVRVLPALTKPEDLDELNAIPRDELLRFGMSGTFDFQLEMSDEQLRQHRLTRTN